MRKALSLASAVVLVVLVVSILRSAPEGPDSLLPSVETVAGSPFNDVTDTTGGRIEPGPANSPESVTDGTRGTTTTNTALQARFVLSEVVFGDNGYIAVRNVGGASGNLEGYAISQEARSFLFPSVEVGLFEVVWVAVEDGTGLTRTDVAALIPAEGAIGRLDRAGGEMTLYRSAQFSQPEEFLSYVEWGETDHGRSGLAIEAGLWEEGAFIEIPPDAFGVVSTTAQPDSSSDWVAGVGG